MFTFKLKPKQIFGGILLLTGIVVILITFLGNHPASPTSAKTVVNCETYEQRLEYLASLGWETDGEEGSK